MPKKQSSNGDKHHIDNVNDLMLVIEDMVVKYEVSIYDKIVDVLKKDSNYEPRK